MNDIRNAALAGLVVLCALFAIACGGGGGGGENRILAPTPIPTLLSFTPASGVAGTVVTISGTEFLGTSAVRFAGTDAASYSVDSAAQITATVPSGADSGTLSVITPGGMVTSSGTFVVNVPAPTLSTCAPMAGKAGTAVIITGTSFSNIAEVRIAGTPCSYTRNSSTQITAVVPSAGAGVGVVSVATASGTVSSSSPFSVMPDITSLSPSQGPPGTPVILAGSGFTNEGTVSFSGVTAPVSYQSATQMTVTVPALATGSKSLVTSTTGGTSSARTFTVTSGGGPTLDLSIEGVYLTQSTQDFAGTVPLVAGRNALLRVFVKASEGNGVTPVVRATLLNGGSTVWGPATIYAPGSATPTAISEGVLASSWNVLVPGTSLTQNCTLTIEVDPGDLISESNETNNALSRNLEIRNVPALHVTLVPIDLASGIGNVTEANKTGWVDLLKRMFPLNATDVQVRSPYTASVRNVASDGVGWGELLLEIRTLRGSDARHYIGGLKVGYGSGVAGMGYIGYPTCISWDKSGSSPEVLAHEVGHNFGRYHAPCGGPSGVDSSWPTAPVYSGARIGVWGWDSALGANQQSALKDPAQRLDLMSYCDPTWISDYTYRGVLASRGTSPDLVQADAISAPLQECLLVSGRILYGRTEIVSSFQVMSRPETPTTGTHELILLDGAGRELRRVSFEPLRIADLPDGQDEQHFVLVIPMDSNLERDLRGLRIQRDGLVLAQRLGGQEPNARVVPRAPVATRMKPGLVHLSWDASVYPRALVRDPGTRDVLAMPEGGSLTLATGASELEVTFSDGVRSLRQILPVQE